MPGLFSVPLSLGLLDECLAAWFLPTCQICGAESGASPLCETCREVRLFHPIEPPWCERCGAPAEAPLARCGRCLVRLRLPLAQVRSLFWLGEADRELVHKIKYWGRFELLKLWREAFLDHFEIWFPTDVTVVPVPLHWSRWRKRYFNQAEALALWIAEVAHARVETERLRKLRASPSQAGLSREARAYNLRHHFSWVKGAAPERVLLVDDVYTTGATLEACARALRRAGCKAVYGWTLLRTPRVAEPRGIRNLLM